MNKQEATITSSIILKQKLSFDSDLKDPENLTFSYVNKSNDIDTFYVTIDGSTALPADVTKFPTGLDAGFCVQPGGVYVYIKHYFNGPSWTDAISVVEEGVSNYISQYVNTGTNDGLCATVILSNNEKSTEKYSINFNSKLNNLA